MANPTSLIRWGLLFIDVPSDIDGWTETFPSGFGSDAKMVTTKATRHERTMQPYGKQNRTADEPLRKKWLVLER